MVLFQFRKPLLSCRESPSAELNCIALTTHVSSSTRIGYPISHTRYSYIFVSPYTYIPASHYDSMSAVCELKGFLSFLILWVVSKQPMNGATVAEELTRRRGTRPSPGTLYPALHELHRRGLIQPDAEKRYHLTAKGRRELDQGVQTFCTIFSDFSEMRSSCAR